MSIRHRFFVVFFGIALMLLPAAAMAKNAAILSYMRVGEDQYPHTNIRLDQFEAHMEELARQQYKILSLEDIITGKHTQNAIAITFDGGYKSTLHKALPILEKYNFPFTVFYASDLAQKNTKQHLNFKELKKLSKNPLVTIGIHPHTYARLTKTPEKIAHEINRAKSHYRDAFKSEAEYFAYPFGEYSSAYVKNTAAAHFKAAFTQHSSPLPREPDMHAFPRFVMTEAYADIERMALVANTKVLDIKDFVPSDPYIKNGRLHIAFTINTPITEKNNLACYVSGYGKMPITFITDKRVTLKKINITDQRRVRLNCTYRDKNEGWHWFGRLFTSQQPALLEPLE